MFLVYEKNYLCYEIDCVEESEMKLWSDENKAIADMNNRKQKYIEDEENDFTFLERESSPNCFVFADGLSKDGKFRSGEYHV